MQGDSIVLVAPKGRTGPEQSTYAGGVEARAPPGWVGFCVFVVRCAVEDRKLNGLPSDCNREKQGKRGVKEVQGTDSLGECRKKRSPLR